MALMGMMRSSLIGDKVNTQKFMRLDIFLFTYIQFRYRIYAQFFTIFAILAGVAYFTEKLARQDAREKKEQEEADKKKIFQDKFLFVNFSFSIFVV